MLETRDDQGFSLDDPAVLHYLVRAGVEKSRGSSPLPDTTPFEDQFSERLSRPDMVEQRCFFHHTQLMYG